MVASGSWPFQVNLLKAEGAAGRPTIPEEGATGWADTTMMQADAAHPNCAYLWMEHSLSPNLQSDLSVWFGSNPVVPAACTDGSGSRPRRAAPPTASTTSTHPLLDDAGGELRQGECVPYYRWVSDYIGVIGGR